MNYEIDKLVEGWLQAQGVDVESTEYDQVSWAIDELFDLAYDEPDSLLEIVIEILRIDSSQKVIGALGAGVLEELLVNHGDNFIGKILRLSKENLNFKKCLSFVYVDKDDVSADVYKIIKAEFNKQLGSD